MARSERSTRPPSIGKAGMRLKSTSMTFTEASFASMPIPGCCTCSSMLEVGRPAEKENEHSSDHKVNQRACDGDDELLPRLIGHALKTRHATDGQQRNVRRGDAEGARSQRVAELVQQYAPEQRDNEQHARDGSGRAADVIIRESNPCQEEKEGEMDTNFGSGNPCNFNGPAHGI